MELRTTSIRKRVVWKKRCTSLLLFCPFSDACRIVYDQSVQSVYHMKRPGELCVVSHVVLPREPLLVLSGGKRSETLSLSCWASCSSGR